MPVTRTSLPGAAVVAVVNRCIASRSDDARRSSAARSTAGRQAEVNTVGSANTASSTSAGWIDISSAMATPSRSRKPQVENSDMYMWSSTKIWLRSTESRSRCSGFSWCAIVAISACSRATCASSAIVTLSRKRRCTRVLSVARNQVKVADTPSPRADSSSRRRSLEITPSPRNLIHSGSSASGSAASCDSPKAASIIRGSWR
jgi:hypothetical protein